MRNLKRSKKDALLENNFERLLKSLYNFLMFFMTIAAVVTCNFLLFLNNMDMEYETLIRSAKVTFINVILFSVIFCMIDLLRRIYTVNRPVKRICEGVDRVIGGDFSTRIAYIHGEDSGNEFDQIIKGLNKMIEELSSVETLKTDFIANVSHELKTPLAVIQNYGVLLQNDDITKDELITYGQAISEQTKRLSMLITNILKLNKLENQQIYPNKEEYNLGEQLCECMLEYEHIWEEKRIEIETQIDKDVMIYADKELLSLVWYNLLSNALKFTDAGGKVTLALEDKEDGVYISVTDTGCGMSSETGMNIFKKFYQGDTSHATKGNGLGLALVKRVIDICSGEISVNSELGKGSTFTVKLRRNIND